MRWEPEAYLQFADERARPFHDLMARVRAEAPEAVIDLGCGPGTLTRLLAERWPAALVTGVASSAERVARAEPVPGRLDFAVGDLREWAPDRPVDVLVSNATLQWVPGHLELLPHLAGHLAPGGWLAVQVPGNFAERTHTAIAEVSARPPWRERLAAAPLEWPASEEPATYLAALAEHVTHLDVWETTYLQVLRGPDPVVSWMTGTGLRPVLSRLDAEEQEQFLEAYRSLVADAYPQRPWGTVLPYRRIFLVARR